MTGVFRRRRSPRWLLIGSAGVVAVVAAVAYLALGRLPIETPTSAAAARSSDATAEARSPDPAPAELNLAKAGWFRFDGSGLDVGTLDGRQTAHVAVGGAPLEGLGSPWAAGPTRGWVLYTQANRQDLQLVNVLSGEHVSIPGLDGTAMDGLLDPSATYAFIAVRRGNQDGGVWRVPLDPSERRRQILPPDPTLAAHLPDFGLAAHTSFHEQLALSPDGGELALVACETSCSVRWVDLRTGETRGTNDSEAVTDVAGVVGGIIVDSFGTAIDTHTWQEASAAGGTPLMTETGARMLTGAGLLEPSTGETAPIPPSGHDLVPMLDLPGWLGAELPAGWVLQIEHFAETDTLGQACEGQYVAYRPTTGQVTPLPVFGRAPFCG